AAELVLGAAQHEAVHAAAVEALARRVAGHLVARVLADGCVHVADLARRTGDEVARVGHAEATLGQRAAAEAEATRELALAAGLEAGAHEAGIRRAGAGGHVVAHAVAVVVLAVADLGGRAHGALAHHRR